jgi:hypothetical protein
MISPLQSDGSVNPTLDVTRHLQIGDSCAKGPTPLSCTDFHNVNWGWFCWPLEQTSRSSDQLACLDQLWGKSLTLVTLPAAESGRTTQWIPPVDLDRAGAVKLTSGQYCRQFPNIDPGFWGEYSETYDCGDSLQLYGRYDRTQPFWTIGSLDRSKAGFITRGPKRQIAVAYFARPAA